MALTAAELHIIIRARDEASRELERLGDTFKTLPAFIQATTTAIIGMTAASAVLGTVVGVQMNAQIERLEVGFGILRKSVDAAHQQVAEMIEFTRQAPFEFEGLAQNVRFLMAMGFAAKDAIPMLRLVGDQISAMGAGQDRMFSIILALGQMKLAGRVYSQDMFQLTNAGIAAWELLAKAIGKSVEETRDLAQKQHIDSAVAIKAITEGMREQSEGAMEAQTQTFLGAWTIIKNNTRVALAEMTQDIFVFGRDAAVSLANFMRSAEFKKNVAETRDSIRDLGYVFKGAAAEMERFAAVSERIFSSGLVPRAIAAAGTGNLQFLDPRIDPRSIREAALATDQLRAAEERAARARERSILQMSGPIGLLVKLTQLLREEGKALDETRTALEIFGDAGLEASGDVILLTNAFKDSRTYADQYARAFKVSEEALRMMRLEIFEEEAALRGFTGVIDLATGRVNTYAGELREAVAAQDLLAKSAIESAAAIDASWRTKAGMQISGPSTEMQDIELKRRAELAADEAATIFRTGVLQLGQWESAVRQAAGAAEQFPISINEMASAMAQAHPAVLLLSTALVGLRDQLAANDAAIRGSENAIANLREQIDVHREAIQGWRDEIAATNFVLGELGTKISDAKTRLSELASVQLVGMGAMDKDISAVDRTIKRLQFTRAGGVLTPEMMPTPEEIARLTELFKTMDIDIVGEPLENLGALQKLLQQLQTGKDLTYGEQLKKIQEALKGTKAEMTFDEAIAEIQTLKSNIALWEEQTKTHREQIKLWEADIKSADLSIRALEGQIRVTEQSIAAMRDISIQLQRQIQNTEATLNLMRDALIKVFTWLLEDRDKIIELGGAAQDQAKIVDEKTVELLKLFSAFARSEADVTTSKISSVVQAWINARDEISRIAGEIKLPPGAPKIEGSKQYGTDFIERTGAYVLHRGEAVIPANRNASFGGNIAVYIGGQEIKDFVVRIVDEQNRGAAFLGSGAGSMSYGRSGI